MLLTFTNQVSFPLIAGAVFGFSFLRSIAVANENPLLCDLLAPKQRSTAIGFMNAANTFAGGVGVFAVGILKRDYALGDIFAGVSLILLAAAGVTALGYRFVLPRDLRRGAAACLKRIE
jgi:predicted MFS family arabinose efflux permease